MRVFVPLHDASVGSRESGLVTVLTPVGQTPMDAADAAVSDVSPYCNLQATSASVSASSSPASDRRSPVLHVGDAVFVLTPSLQRLLSNLVLAPAITCCVWFAPLEAVALLVSLSTTVGSYEFAWFAYRIVKRLDVGFRHYERQRSATVEAQDSPLSPTARRDGEGANDSHVDNENDDEQDASFELAVVDTQQCVVSRLAQRFCHRTSRWLAALTLALPVSALLSVISAKILGSMRPSDAPPSTFTWVYLVSTRYIAVLCALLTPTPTWMALMLWQAEIFNVMAAQTLSCPMAVFSCSTADNSTQLLTVFVIGVVGILLWCALMSPHPVRFVTQATLAVTGFVYVQGLGLALICLLDANDLESSRSILVFLLLVVWTAQASAYVWKTLAVPQWGHSTPLHRRLSASVDLEGSLVAVCCGVSVMAMAVQFLTLPGGDNVAAYIVMTVVGIGCMRVNELLVRLWACVADVKHTGTSLPGHRGLLERLTALVFATLGFLPYLAYKSH